MFRGKDGEEQDFRSILRERMGEIGEQIAKEIEEGAGHGAFEVTFKEIAYDEVPPEIRRKLGVDSDPHIGHTDGTRCEKCGRVHIGVNVNEVGRLLTHRQKVMWMLCIIMSQIDANVRVDRNILRPLLSGMMREFGMSEEEWEEVCTFHNMVVASTGAHDEWDITELVDE